MLADRYYMRDTEHRPIWSATVVLMVVNGVIFVPFYILSHYRPAEFRELLDWLALSKEGMSKGLIWQLFTFQFLHGGVWHLLGNLIVLYFFGNAMEDALGSRRFLKLYFSSGVCGGILQLIFLLAIPSQFAVQVIGASAGCFGLVAAFATLFPDRLLTLLLFFVIPFSMRARTLLWFAIGISVMGILVPKDNIADAAHLGGIMAGCAYIFWFVQGRTLSFSWPAPPRRKQRELVNTTAAKKAFWQRTKLVDSDDLPPAEFISKEVDPILDKISAHGIQSLTERERKILEMARAKMAKR